jgi:hypothetical protein
MQLEVAASEGRSVARRKSSADENRSQFLPVETLRRQYLDYLTCKVAEIEEAKEARRYYHGAHYTPDEIRVLRARRQPPVVWNRIARKINGIVGVVQKQRRDPKAFPTKPKGEAGAEIATQTIRTVLDGNDWETRDEFCLRQAATEGIGGIELRLVAGDQGDPDIEMWEVFGDDFFYQPTSVRFDFSDARYKGIAKWVDVDEAVELFPDREELIRGLIESGSDLTTNADREYKWINTTTKRVRLIEHWYKHRGVWCWAFYISNQLLEEGVSPFKDERRRTIARFIMFRAAVDQDGDTYGFVRNFKGPQDELNQSRSKSNHVANSRRLIADKGAVDDVETARREWARPDGYIEKNPGKEIAPDNTTADLAAQLQRAQTAADEIENFANTNIANMTDGAVGNLSGVAINLLTQPGLAELGPFIKAYRGWKLRVYRAVFNLAQQYWTSERWVRVTDDEDVAHFIQINGLDLDDYGRPAMVNYLGALDVDIKLDEGPDEVTQMQDTYDVIKNDPAVPAQVKIAVAPIQGSVKKRILAMLQPPVDPAQAIMKRLALEGASAENESERARAEERRARAVKDAAGAAALVVKAGLNGAEAYKASIEAGQGGDNGPGAIQGLPDQAPGPGGAPTAAPMPMIAPPAPQFPLPFGP